MKDTEWDKRLQKEELNRRRYLDANSYTMTNWKKGITDKTPKIIHPTNLPKDYDYLKEEMRLVRERYPIEDGWEVVAPTMPTILKEYKEDEPPTHFNLIYYGLEKPTTDSKK